VESSAPRSRAERKAQTRRRLIEAAQAAFAEKGYGATQIRDIVGRAGTAIGTFYVHFPDKRGVFIEILDEATSELVRLLVARVAAEHETLARVRAIFEQFLDYLAENANLFVLLREGRNSDSEFAPVLRETFDLLNRELEHILRRGMERGEIAAINSRVLSRALLGLGLESIALLHEEGVPREDVLEAVDRLVVYGLRGMPE